MVCSEYAYKYSVYLAFLNINNYSASINFFVHFDNQNELQINYFLCMYVYKVMAENISKIVSCTFLSVNSNFEWHSNIFVYSRNIVS